MKQIYSWQTKLASVINQNPKKGNEIIKIQITQSAESFKYFFSWVIQL